MSSQNWSERIFVSIGLKQWGYDRLNQSEGRDSATTQSSLGAKFVKIAGGLALFWIIILTFTSPFSEVIHDLVLYNTTAPSYLHVLLPANEGTPDLCKTLFSAAALDYPTPRIINWGKEYKDPDVAYGGAHIAKIEGILGFLRQLGPHSDADLVLIADGYDTWFQLRPSVLIDRYHAINARANYRIASQMGYLDMITNEIPINQTVVFAAQKRCYPAAEDDPGCYAVPESDLPTDVYGPLTDRDSGDQESPFKKYRQKYLNSGTIMGPAGDLKRTFEAALVKAKEMPAETGSDQAAFASLFGEQEYEREVIRQRNQTSWQKFSDKFYRGYRQDILADHPTRKRPELGDDPRYEFGIGLDYRGEISLPIVFSEDDAIWLEYSSASSIREAAQKAGVPAPDPPRVPHLAEDIKNSTPPFWTADYTGQTHVPDKDWSDVRLFTNIWTGISPVTIHHNSRVKGVKSRIRMSWSDAWFFPYLRDILFTKANSYRMPVAISRGQEWWGPIDERGGVRIEIGSPPGDWLNWEADTLCGTSEVANEVLRDRRGPFVNPIYYLSWDVGEANEALDRWQQLDSGEEDLQE